jgi:hypothetical protein
MSVSKQNLKKLIYFNRFFSNLNYSAPYCRVRAMPVLPFSFVLIASRQVGETGRAINLTNLLLPCHYQNKIRERENIRVDEITAYLTTTVWRRQSQCWTCNSWSSNSKARLRCTSSRLKKCKKNFILTKTLLLILCVLIDSSSICC